ncbi:MAG: NmrA family transcriptional regulator, partial [Bacteroidetes bacterium]|nr:NmrA family transcriptional regulator [Bacteroidota bacterium]
SKATGRSITYHPITLDEYTDGMKQSGLPSDYIWLFEYLFKEVLGNPKNQVISNDVERVLDRKAKDFSEFAAETAETGVWDPSISQIA